MNTRPGARFGTGHWCGRAFYRRTGGRQAHRQRIVDIARRPPDLARATQATSDGQGNSYPIIDGIVTLIAQCCALTIGRLTQSSIRHRYKKRSFQRNEYVA